MPENEWLTRHWRRETLRNPRPGPEIGHWKVPPAVSKCGCVGDSLARSPFTMRRSGGSWHPLPWMCVGRLRKTPSAHPVRRRQSCHPPLTTDATERLSKSSFCRRLNDGTLRPQLTSQDDASRATRRKQPPPSEESGGESATNLRSGDVDRTLRRPMAFGFMKGERLRIRSSSRPVGHSTASFPITVG